APPRVRERIVPWPETLSTERCRGSSRRAGDARLARVQTLTLQGVPEVAARQGQAEKVAQIAFFATALFAAQLYLSPAQWFPLLEPLHHAAILSVVGLAALGARRALTNQPLWMGWRTGVLAIYTGAALFSPLRSIPPEDSQLGALEVLKHFLFFLAVVNAFDTPP